MTQVISNYLSIMPDWLQLIIMSMIPVVELRGAIPWGLFFLHTSPLMTYLLCVFGSIIPAPFILLFFQSILKWMRHSRIFKRFAQWLDDKAEKGKKKIEKYEFWGLMIFVAIPLPGTGVWTGCLAASAMEMSLKRGLLSCFLGSAIAGVIVTILCETGLMVVNYA